MIRICKSSSRHPEEYAVLAAVLGNGMKTICVNNCPQCPWKNLCNSVMSAINYAMDIAENDN